MPVSKRNRVVSLTQTKKKGLEHKEKLVNEVRDSVDEYDFVYIFSIENMRNNKLKEVREEWKGTSKLIMGKNKVLQIALGRNAENEIADNIHKVSERLLGQCGLLLTSQPEEEVIEWFNSFREPDFARAGFVATETVILKEDDLSEFSHTMEPQFRRLGLPTKLVNGKIKLLQDFTVCTEGDTLTPEMADVLKHKGIQMADFHVTLEFLWRKKDGSFKVLQEKEGRSVSEVKKSKAKRGSEKRRAKRAKKDKTQQEDEEEEDDEDDHGDEDDDEEMEEDDDEEEEELEELVKKSKTKKEKENHRPIKQAKRQSKKKADDEKVDHENDVEMEDEEEVKAKSEKVKPTEKRQTRASMRAGAK